MTELEKITTKNFNHFAVELFKALSSIPIEDRTENVLDVLRGAWKASREEAIAELENGTLIVCDCCGKVKGYKGALGNTCLDCV